jgi:glycine cleavage system aminomethyltransferase T
MSLTAGSRREPPPFDAVLRRAGAVLATRDGQPVAINFGSAAAELAVCVRAVGLVDRSELCKLALEAPPAQLAPVMARVAGDSVSPGGVVSASGAWWCGEEPDRVLVLCDPPTGARLLERLRTDAVGQVAVHVRDVSAELAAIGLLGRSAGQVLRELGVYGASGDVRRARPFTRRWVDGIPAWWLLQSDRRAIALVSREDAGAAWLAIERVGRPFGISCVGYEAAARYALVERLRSAELPFG